MPAPEEELTSREVEVLHHLADGRSVQEIADEMYLSYETVKGYMTALRQKLDARSQLQVALAAARRGLLADDHPLGGRDSTDAA